MMIAVTAMGVWSGAGTSLERFSSHVISGGGPTWITQDLSTQVTTLEAPDPPTPAGFPQARRMDRSVHLALAAASEAYAAAGLDALDPCRIAVLVGNSRGPAGKWSEPRSRRLRPTQAANTAVASLSGALSLAFRIRGPCLTVSATCASAAHAFALGAALLRAGEVDAVLAGGAEAPLVDPVLDQFQAARLLGSHEDPALACRPFDRTRNGIVPGEGAAFLVLETSEHARARRRVPHAILAGWATGSEAHNRVASRTDGAGLASTIQQALDRAGARPDEVGYLNAHGTGTRLSDASESAAIETVFGSAGIRPPVSSTKPVTGHVFGAAPALEAIVAIEALKARKAPPTWSCRDPDPDLGLDLILGSSREIRTRVVVSTSLGFWGNTAALVFRSP